MALKPVLDSLDGVSPALKEHYTKATDGKFVLQHDGQHPDLAKVKEFRDNNVALTTKVTAQDAELAELRPLREKVAAFAGIDLEAAKVALTNADTLKAELATEKAARLEAQTKVDSATINAAITDAFLKAGGRPKATAFILNEAKDKFSLVNGVITSSVFSTEKPAEKLSVTEFIAQHVKSSHFAFHPSTGSGATGTKPSPFGPSRNTGEQKPQATSHHGIKVFTSGGEQ